MPEISVQECIQICRSAAFETEVEEALGVLDRFIRDCKRIGDSESLGKLVQTFVEHKYDMDSQIYLAGTRKTATLPKTIAELEDQRIMRELELIAKNRL